MGAPKIRRRTSAEHRRVMERLKLGKHATVAVVVDNWKTGKEAVIAAGLDYEVLAKHLEDAGGRDLEIIEVVLTV